MLQEDEAILNVERMNELDILRFIHPKISLEDSTKVLLGNIGEVISWYELSFLEEKYERWKVYFLVLIENLHKSEILSLCKNLSMSEKEKKELLQSRDHARNALVKMAKQRILKNSELYHLLSPLTTECLLYLMAKVTRNEAKKSVSKFLAKLKHTKIKTTGGDLKKLGLLPGKLYKRILDNLLNAKLDGKVQNKSDEIAFVKKNCLT